MRRINVIGTSGSGKSTFSKKLAAALDVPYIELDALFWRPGWTGAPDDEFFTALEDKLQSSDGWVLDGNYSRTTPIKWKYADTVVWLDYPFWLTTLRVTKRAIWRAWSQEELWPGTGNTESFRNMLTKDGIVWWSMSSYGRNKERYEAIFESSEYPHLDFVRLRSPKECERFLAGIKDDI